MTTKCFNNAIMITSYHPREDICSSHGSAHTRARAYCLPSYSLVLVSSHCGHMLVKCFETVTCYFPFLKNKLSSGS